MVATLWHLFLARPATTIGWGVIVLLGISVGLTALNLLAFGVAAIVNKLKRQ